MSRPGKRLNVVFVDPRYPGHFEAVAGWLSEQAGASVAFVCETVTRPPPAGVRIVPCSPDPQGATGRPYFFSRYFEAEARSMFGVLRAVEDAQLGTADLFVGHAASGSTAMLRTAFPRVPAVGLFERFHDQHREGAGRAEYPPGPENRLRSPLRNATQLLELQMCTAGWSPTPYQKSTFPEELHGKLSVRWEPVDTARFAPGPPLGALEPAWPRGARLVTYVARGLEAYRGFDLFMDVACLVAERLPDVHFAVAGAAETYSGHELAHIPERSFKEHVLKEHEYPRDRFHFLDWISEDEVADLLKLSSVHFHWTVPHALSRSAIQAAASGALIVASDTAPVRDLLEHGYSGLLFELYDVEAGARLVIDGLEDPVRYRPVREAARKVALQRHALEVAAPKLAELFEEVAGRAP
ncbi:MAG TPA: glycosyltransferase [Myxococcales bacterium]|nr:glycosyltransferase [Myxococcales bacterium]